MLERGAMLMVVVVLVVAGCSTGADKAGGQGPTITLKAAVGEPQPASAANEQMAIYAAKVKDLSGGAITIEIKYGGGGDDFEEGVGSIRDTTVVRLVRDGAYDLAWVPARSWDVKALGVTSLRAVSAPFLVTSYALAAKIATGKLATDLMAGLSGLDVTGLALLPDRLRYPAGSREPLLRLEDFAGKKMRVPNSETTHMLVRALGAEPGDWEAWQAKAASGEILGAESAFNFLYAYPPGSFITGNVTLYMKMNTIVARTAAYERLTDDQRAIMRAAADATVADVIQAIPDESAAAAAACQDGATVVLASEEDLATLNDAALVVYAELEKDQRTKVLIGAIRDLKAQTPSANPVQACGPGSPPASSSPSLAPGDASVINGTYRLGVDADEVRAWGIEEPEVLDWVGRYEITLTDGTYEWRLIQELPTHDPWIVHGTYTVSGNTLAADITDPPTGNHGENLLVIEDRYRWASAGDTLTITLEWTNGSMAWEAGGGVLGGDWTRIR